MVCVCKWLNQQEVDGHMLGSVCKCVYVCVCTCVCVYVCVCLGVYTCITLRLFVVGFSLSIWVLDGFAFYA